MFERFTERARQVVLLAQEEARTMQLDYIGTEHILLGLLREEEGLAARVLASLDVTLDKARESVKTRLSKSVVEDPPQTIPFTPRAKKALEMALREALSLGHNYIGTEHVALGLIREGENFALEILRDDFNVSGPQVRTEVIRVLSGPKAPILRKDKESKPVTLKNQVATGELGIHPIKVSSMLGEAIELARNYPSLAIEEVAKAVMTKNGETYF
jgi:ATP-dependent Clp protease ATP-binding subunit ClpA